MAGHSESPRSVLEAFGQAVGFVHAGNLDAAELVCAAILETQRDDFDALHLLGVIAVQRGRFEAADQLLSRALTIRPQSPDANSNRANVLNALRRFDDALAAADRALAIKRQHAEALYHRGVALHNLHRYDDAVASYDMALAIRPDFPAALTNRGGALQDLGHYEEAVASFDRALSLRPGNAEALYNRGLSLQRLQRYEEALASYDAALAVRPAFAEALNNRGFNQQCLHRLQEARASYDRALAIKPDFVEALYNRGTVLSSMSRHEQASRDVARALALNPGLPYAQGTLLHSRMYCCDWRGFDEDSRRLLADVRAGKRSADPATIFNISDSANDQLLCARTWVEDKFPSTPLSLRTVGYRHDRIRLAYLSADFHDHATAHLIAGLFERHDKTRFEAFAISFGRDTRGEMRTRLERAIERFVDVRNMSDREVAELLRSLEIDIAVDLKGFTDDARPQILAQRPAPVQVSYLGYPGTMGADYIDYILADAVVVPPEHHPYYVEKVVYLPGSYQVNDSKRRIAERTLSRNEAGLPDAGFVFCSFNNSYKITPEVFGVWMRLLRQVDDSVLWLLEGNSAARDNLRREAAERGISPERLVFAPKIDHADHLARHNLADLFLDTVPCNAHTTASDALWAGLPVLTCLGTTFAGRVAASLLHAVGLSELAANTLAGYEALALELVANQDLLAEIRQKLERNRESAPLFDTDRSRRHIEAAYVKMWERHQRGEPPVNFAISPIA